MFREFVRGCFLATLLWAGGGQLPLAQEESGGLRWCYAASEDILFAPAVSKNGAAYIATDDQRIRAISASGRVLWAVDPGGKPTSGMALQGGLLFFGTSREELAAYSTNGHMAWRRRVDSILVATPAVSPDGTVYAGTLKGTLYALNPRGRILWSYNTGDDVVFSPAVAQSGRIYLASTKNLYAFETDGRPAWIKKLALPLGSPMALDNLDGICYVDAEGTLHHADSHGNEDWTATSSTFASAPVVSADMVYVCEGSAPPPPTGHAISGTVTLSTGGGLGGVVVSTTGVSDTTGSDGTYSLANLADGTHTVTPTLTGYTFEPATLSVTVQGADVTGKDFVATAASLARGLDLGTWSTRPPETEEDSKVTAYSLADGIAAWAKSYGGSSSAAVTAGGGALVPSNDFNLRLFDSAGTETKVIPLDHVPRDVTLVSVKAKTRIYVVCGHRFLNCIDTALEADPSAPWGQLGGLPSRVNRRSDLPAP